MADASNLNEVRALIAARKTELLTRYKANGVAIGKSSINPSEYAIVVYVNSLPASVVDSLEGVELRLVEAGPFKAL